MFHKKLDRFGVLLIIEAALLLIVLLTCFRGEKQIYSVLGENIGEQLLECDGYREFAGETMELLPGVYQLRMQVDPGEEETIFAQVQCTQAYFKTLRNNGATVLPGDTDLEFNIYVLDRIPEAYVFCRFTGADAAGIRNLSVYRTSMGNRILFVLLLSLFVILDFLLVFRRRILAGRVTVKRQVVFWTLWAGILVAFFPYLTDYFSLTGDIDYHLGRIAFLKDALEQWEIPVRMQGTWLYGHGYATSLFCGDLFLYFPACLMLSGFSIMSAYKIFVFAVTAAGAWIAYHCFFRCVKEEYAALFGSMMYTLAPYRLFNIYNRGAVGEFLAMAFLPMICCGVYLLYTENESCSDYRKHKWYIIWGMSGLLQSHLITSEMTALMMALVCALFWKKTFRRQTFIQLLEAIGITLLINMWFWLPLLYMIRIDTYQFQTVIKENMVNGTVLAGALQLLPNKGSAQMGMWQCEPIQLGAGALLFLLLYMLWRIKGHKVGRACRFLALLSVLTVILSTAYLPWNMLKGLPLIGYFIGSLQFPFRWMAIAAAAAAMFSAFFYLEVYRNGGVRLRIFTAVVGLVVIMSAVYHVNDCAFQAAPLFLYNVENMGTVGFVNGEWLLAGTEKNEICYHEPMAEKGLIWRDYEKRGTTVDISLENTTEETLHLELPLMGYKGYEIAEAENGGGASPNITEERGAHNDLRIEVPAGYKGRIQVAWRGFAIFRIAEAVSLASLLVILIMWGRSRKRKVQNEGK